MFSFTLIGDYDIANESPRPLCTPVAIHYAAGLGIHGCLSLRIKVIDLVSRVVSVRNGKGSKDRMTVLPERLV